VQSLLLFLVWFRLPNQRKKESRWIETEATFAGVILRMFFVLVQDDNYSSFIIPAEQQTTEPLPVP
jgi:hypothetical protein